MAGFLTARNGVSEVNPLDGTEWLSLQRQGHLAAFFLIEALE